MSSKVIILGMTFDAGSAPNFGSLYGVKIRAGDIKAVNDYAGETESDADKLDNITNAAPGSTCLFSNGSLYRLELSGWKKFGESGTSQAAASTSGLHLSPLGIDRNTLYGDDAVPLDYEPDLPEETAADVGRESTLEAQKSAVTSSTADEVSL